MISITRTFKFEMAHYLPNHNGNCRFLHGHSYKLEVTVTPLLNNKLSERNVNDPQYGMVIDFGNLNKIVQKKIIDVFDHSLTVWDKYVDDDFKKGLDQFNDRINYIDYRPTAELMCIDFYNRIDEELRNDLIKIKKIKLYETDNSYAEYESEI